MLPTQSVTFVTSILHIYENDYEEYKTISWRIDRFKELVALGIKICIYVSPEMEPLIRVIESANPNNIKIMRVLRCEDTIISHMLQEHCPDYKLPDHRNEGKDKAKYSIVINSKTEFMADTVIRNPWNTRHFAWIDFNIAYVFSNKSYTFPFLQWMGSQPYIKSNCFVIPGCWNKYDNENTYQVTNQINWRFCGGFFIADADSILHFHNLYLENFPKFLREFNTLVWEVNFWAWLERNSDWNPTWYWGDHNDTIICNIPIEFFTRPLDSKKTNYSYPVCENPVYLPSSASYLATSCGKHILNTRYVNYWYHDEGYYQFYTDEMVIRNKNFLSELDPENQWRPLYYKEMKETVELAEYNHGSRGIEDIRLYEFHGKIRYIATTMGYHNTGGTRMITGDYCIDRMCYENSMLIESPENNHLEKNWVPLVVRNKNSRFHDRELFVYKWSPFQIGELYRDPVTSHARLNIVEKYETNCEPLFHKLKGSTPFIPMGDDCLIGVVHFTEEAKPRKYYHMLVALDNLSLRPLRYSNPFCFEKCSIEFCIGFRIHNGEYIFWISRMDRSPTMMTIGLDEIPLSNMVG